eukprot:CAMPEP_0172871416 /NCGR_PEP_ID=MMETSP1075-20121228/92071_1 /TAXON_ID=2916 /ORGANISM="Ceratium fusus, Strain PA161109" /LENGTH=169 /DNA_ID=CAMNT_0013721649 /DNA_START=42 /DNA_END=548 /DNA_ORIENTATION=-
MADRHIPGLPISGGRAHPGSGHCFTFSPELLPTPCRAGRHRPSPLQYAPMQASHVTGHSQGALSRHRNLWQHAEAQRLWESRSRFRFYASVAAVVLAAVVVVLGSAFAFGWGRHGAFQTVRPSKPMSADVGDVIRLPVYDERPKHSNMESKAASLPAGMQKATAAQTMQ